MRLSIQYLKENEPKWRSRKIKECERIRQEEKNDRLAISKMKKMRYGIKGLNKEENGRMKQRTEERLEIARAKENYWKLHRGEGERDEERCNAWKKVKECITSLEEIGNWNEKGEMARGAGGGEDDRKANDDLRLPAKLTAKTIMVEPKLENSEKAS